MSSKYMSKIVSRMRTILRNTSTVVDIMVGSYVVKDGPWELEVAGYFRSEWRLYHYGRLLVTIHTSEKDYEYEVILSDWVNNNGMSVSDQRGINSLLEELNIPTRFSRAGRTAKYPSSDFYKGR